MKKQSSILSMYSQVKLQLLERKMTMDVTFPTLNESLEDTENIRLDDNVKSKIISNLQSLPYEFVKYFPDITRDNFAFVRNPYLVADMDLVGVINEDVDNQEEFIALKKWLNYER